LLAASKALLQMWFIFKYACFYSGARMLLLPIKRPIDLGKGCRAYLEDFLKAEPANPYFEP
jgi:hypothetical protein